MVINKRGTIAITQILILVIGIVAFTWEIGIVSGAKTQAELEAELAGISNSGQLSNSGGIVGEEVGTAGRINNRIEAPNPAPAGSGSVTANVFKAGPMSVKDFKFSGGTAVSVESSMGISGVPEYKGFTKDGTDFTISSEELKAKGMVASNGNLKSPGTDSTVGDWMLKYTSSGTANFLGHLASGIGWATTVYTIGSIIGSFLPEDYKPMANAITTGLAGGIIAGKATYGLIKEGGWFEMKGTTFGMGANGWSLAVGAAVAIGIFLLMYKTTKTEIISFQCKSWDAPTKGSDCEKCNKQELPCSEYQCRSLGQACALVNDEKSGEQMCVWQDVRDANPPEMKAWKEALLENYQYKDPSKPISPPDRGTKIFYTKSAEGCVPAFTPLGFGIETNEPAKCKLDYTRKKTFDEMQFFLGGSSTFKYNHTQVMSLPGPSASENLTIQNDGNSEVYARCMDANGNANTATFVFQFCVDKGPDMTPPVIVTTNLLNDKPVSFGTNSTNIEVYINEPATCKWTHEKDKDYDKMENEMKCSSSVFEMNAQMLYTCKTTLTGLENMKENVFYFKCKDQPLAEEGDRNSMTTGYKFTLIGTQPLVIDEVKPKNETIKGATDSIKVTLEAITSAGFNRGEATCYYSETGEDDSYQMFFYSTSNNMNHEHKQDLYLVSGDYKYFIKCIDLGGNYDVKQIEFSVETDTTAPVVVRAYHIEGYLELVTNEDSKCVSDVKDCSYNFDDGTPVNRVEENNVHYLDWGVEKTYYVKCEDEFGNRPAPNQCSIVVRAFENFKSEEA